MTSTTDRIELNTHGRVLVVDDEPRNRELLRDLLEANGYPVVEAEDGVDALNKASSSSIDVILLDVMMPRMDGLKACRQLKANPETTHIPVLMVSALAERDQRHQGIDAGANDYLTKPIDRRDVLLRVRNAVYAKRLYDKVQEDLAKLRELEILRDNLTHMIMHDMRSPLMVISGSYDVILMEKDRLSPTQHQFITMGKNACRKLIEMATSLLDMSRMEAGQMPLNRVVCDICDIAREAAESVAVLAQEKRLHFRVTGDSVSSAVDRDFIRRVFVNLLGNAIKYSPKGGTIEVEIAATGQTVRATVTDQGCGIPPEYHGKIFEKFGQVDSREERLNHSTGLGLAFCKLAVEAHGGGIGVESPSTALGTGEVGKGSPFWFTLPAALPEGQPVRKAAAQ